MLIKGQIGDQPSQSSVLIFQLLKPSQFAHAHPGIPLFPVIQSGFADPELPAHFQSLGPSFDLLSSLFFSWHFLSFLREPSYHQKTKIPTVQFQETRSGIGRPTQTLNYQLSTINHFDKQGSTKVARKGCAHAQGSRTRVFTEKSMEFDHRITMRSMV